MVETNASTNEILNFYNSVVQAISRVVGYCILKVEDLCTFSVDMLAPGKTQV